jgi:putative ubiquitin-RnfH superfamily antitoxin RatB of RatAB toxin-antitoxin module
MADGTVRVSVLFSPAPREVHEWQLELAAGSTVADAIAASPLRTEFPALDPGALTLGVWGKKAQPGQVLRERDRVEVYRPLLVDPKVARRERFRRQGARAAGLFARKR